MLIKLNFLPSSNFHLVLKTNVNFLKNFCLSCLFPCRFIDTAAAPSVFIEPIEMHDSHGVDNNIDWPPFALIIVWAGDYAY